jgi:hypothetical protein
MRRGARDWPIQYKGRRLLFFNRGFHPRFRRLIAKPSVPSRDLCNKYLVLFVDVIEVRSFFDASRRCAA